MLKKTWPRVRRVVVAGRERWEVDGRPMYGQERFESQELAHQRHFSMRSEAMEHGAGPISHTSRAKVFDTVDLWVASKQAQKDAGELSPRTMEGINHTAKRWIKPVWGPRVVASITTAEVVAWMDSIQMSAQTRANVRIKCGEFFNWCRLRDLCAKNPFEAIRVKVPVAEVEILSVGEVEALLKAARKHRLCRQAAPYAILGLFAGLRPGEARGLTWADVEREQIVIRREITKTRQTRFIPLDPRLAKALNAYRGKGGICKADWRKTWDEVRYRAGWDVQRGGVKWRMMPKRAGDKPWPADVLRHSFASYWLPVFQDRAKLAEIMGNSPAVIRKHYRRAIPRDVADEFWKLL